MITRMGTVSRNRVRAKIMALPSPWKKPGMGQPIMWPMDR